MKIRIYTLGCKVNQFESQAMLGQLLQRGFTQAADGEAADLTIINSCAVTAASESKAMKLIRRIRREQPDTAVLLTGCMAQTIADGQEMPQGVDILLGNKRRSDLAGVVEDYFSQRRRITFIEPYTKRDDYENLEVSSFSGRTRAFLKIEDGYNRFCSYCIIPYARGRVRSCTTEYIDREIKLFAGNGYKEVVVVGINLSCYGSDIGISFADGISAACRAADVRIRLGSLEPESMDMHTLEAFASFPNFCPQFHISLQSGCDETLRRMNRHYTSRQYRQIVSDIRSVFDNASITTDVMVGFAGETDEEFARSVEFVDSIGFAKVHVFPYSRRPGTAADRMTDHIAEDVKKRRAALMSQTAERSRQKFLQSQIGRVEPVLLETRGENGMYEGYTPNYTPVMTSAAEEQINTIVNVRLTKVCGDHCEGEIIRTTPHKDSAADVVPSR